MAAEGTTMQAVLYNAYGDSSVLETVQIPIPTPAADEVLIKVAAAGVNPVDWKLREGYIKAWPQSFPIIPGWDVAGVVTAVGSGVEGLADGDEVFAYTRPLQPGEEGAPADAKIGDNGTYAEYVAVAAAKVAKKPSKSTLAQAGSVPLAGLTAWQGLFDHGALKAGQTVVVLNASGGVGSFAVQFAKHAGATVIGTCSGKNVDFVKGLGADAVVDYTAGGVPAAIKAAAGGKDVDLVYDAVGGASGLEGLEVVKDGGIIVSIANFTVAKDAAEAGGNKTGIAFLVKPSAEQLTTIAGLMDEGKVTVGDLTELPLTEAGKALDLSKAHHVKGKIVLVPGASA